MADSDQQFWPNQVRETIKAADFVVEIKMIDLLDRHGNFSAKLDKNKFDIVFTDETEESVTLTIKRKFSSTDHMQFGNSRCGWTPEKAISVKDVEKFRKTQDYKFPG